MRHALVATLSTAQYRQVKFFTPEETSSYLDGLDAKGTPARTSAPDPSELLTAKEVEVLLRIDVKTVYSYVQRGLIPYVRIQSNVRFVRSEILKWMEERQYKPGGGPRRNESSAPTVADIDSSSDTNECKRLSILIRQARSFEGTSLRVARDTDETHG